ncbi:UNVERIFIED_CONTAM: SRR1 protein [Hammondia hammondi]|eukprot:XP_008883893.1 SRR1 protein [Hammondia hammondi]
MEDPPVRTYVGSRRRGRRMKNLGDGRRERSPSSLAAEGASEDFSPASPPTVAPLRSEEGWREDATRTHQSGRSARDRRRRQGRRGEQTVEEVETFVQEKILACAKELENSEFWRNCRDTLEHATQCLRIGASENTETGARRSSCRGGFSPSSAASSSLDSSDLSIAPMSAAALEEPSPRGCSSSSPLSSSPPAEACESSSESLLRSSSSAQASASHGAETHASTREIPVKDEEETTIRGEREPVQNGERTVKTAETTKGEGTPREKGEEKLEEHRTRRREEATLKQEGKEREGDGAERNWRRKCTLICLGLGSPTECSDTASCRYQLGLALLIKRMLNISDASTFIADPAMTSMDFAVLQRLGFSPQPVVPGHVLPPALHRDLSCLSCPCSSVRESLSSPLPSISLGASSTSDSPFSPASSNASAAFVPLSPSAGLASSPVPPGASALPDAACWSSQSPRELAAVPREPRELCVFLLPHCDADLYGAVLSEYFLLAPFCVACLRPGCPACGQCMQRCRETGTEGLARDTGANETRGKKVSGLDADGRQPAAQEDKEKEAKGKQTQDGEGRGEQPPPRDASAERLQRTTTDEGNQRLDATAKELAGQASEVAGDEEDPGDSAKGPETTANDKWDGQKVTEDETHFRARARSFLLIGNAFSTYTMRSLRFEPFVFESLPRLEDGKSHVAVGDSRREEKRASEGGNTQLKTTVPGSVNPRGVQTGVTATAEGRRAETVDGHWQTNEEETQKVTASQEKEPTLGGEDAVSLPSSSLSSSSSFPSSSSSRSCYIFSSSSSTASLPSSSPCSSFAFPLSSSLPSSASVALLSPLRSAHLVFYLQDRLREYRLDGAAFSAYPRAFNDLAVMHADLEKFPRSSSSFWVDVAAALSRAAGKETNTKRHRRGKRQASHR